MVMNDDNKHCSFNQHQQNEKYTYKTQYIY